MRESYELDVIKVSVDYSGDAYLKCSVPGCVWEHAIGWPDETGNLAQINEIACAHLIETHEGGYQTALSATCSMHPECDLHDGHDGPHRWTPRAFRIQQRTSEGTNFVSFPTANR